MLTQGIYYKKNLSGQILLYWQNGQPNINRAMLMWLEGSLNAILVMAMQNHMLRYIYEMEFNILI